MKHEWARQIIAQNENDIATLIESMPDDILNLINLDKADYQLISHEEHLVVKDQYLKEIEAGWICQKVKGATKCLSGLDDQGRVNTTSKFYCCICLRENRDYIEFCDKCIKADLVIQLFRKINAVRA